MRDIVDGLLTLAKVTLGVVAALIALSLAVLGVFSVSSGNAETAHADCEMRAIEHRIGAAQKAEYRRLCMKSMGYLIMPDCYLREVAVAKCFTPRWVFWVDKLEY